jgi:hypothetical protein
MYIDPDASGPCKIQMFYDGGLEMRAAHVISFPTALVLAAKSIRAVLSKRSSLARHLK